MKLIKLVKSMDSRIKDLESRIAALEPKKDRIGFCVDNETTSTKVKDWDDSNKVFPMHWEQD